MTNPFRVEVSDWDQAQRIQQHVEIGHNFVFVKDGAALAQGGRRGRLFGYKTARPSVLPLVERPVELAGVSVIPAERDPVRMGCVVCDRDLYRAEQDTVHLFICVPDEKRKVRLSVLQNGASFTERELDLSTSVTVETLSMLLAGSYTAVLSDEEGPIGNTVRFTVAEYTLAPLSAQLLSHQLDRDRETLSFSLAVESYQVPFDRALSVTLMDDGRDVIRAVFEPTEPGRYAGLFPISGEGPFRLQLAAADDASRTAEVTIPGSRAHERALTLINELGREVFFSLMPEANAIPIRGGYLTEGDHISTPITAEAVVAAEGKLQVHTELTALVLIVRDMASGSYEVIEQGDVAPGQEVKLPLTSPVSTVFVGCLIDGHPFEAFTSFIREPKVNLQVEVPQEARPQEELAVKLSVSGASNEVPVLLSIRDARLTAIDTPEKALASAAKMAYSSALSFLSEDDKAFVPLAERMTMPEPEYLDVLMAADPMMLDESVEEDFEESDVIMARAPSVMKMRAAPGAMMGKQALVDPAVEGLFGELCEEEEGGEDTGGSLEDPPAEPTSPRATFPEVLFYGLVDVAESETVVIPLADTLATFQVEAFVYADGDWAEVKETFVVDQPVRVDLDIPQAVHAEDRVTGRVRVAAAGGRCAVTVLRDGEVVCKEEVDSPAELSFPVRPGMHVARVEDPASGASDSIELLVQEPGKFKSTVRSLAMLEQGGRLTLDSEDAVSLRVLPAVDEPFDSLMEATAGYEHLCCEQTAAKILAATFMYLATDALAKRQLAEEIILAGIAREKRMWRRGKGFFMYPDSDYVSDYYSRLAAQYLWKLDQIDALPDVSKSLKEAARAGQEMANDAARAHGLRLVPKKITSMEDAYAVAKSKKRGDEAISFVEEHIDASSGTLRGMDGGKRAGWLQRILQAENTIDPVTCRQQLAYGSAALLALGRLGPGIRIANHVTKQFNENGRLYSTVDSVAAIALMIELKRSAIGTGAGRIMVNGSEMTTTEALALSDQVESIEVVEGAAMVEVTRIREEDWRSYSNDLRVLVGFRDTLGRKVNRFRMGDKAELVVQLSKGYKVGDLLHVCLPSSLSWIHGGGRVKRFSIDFADRDEIRIPLVVTAPIDGREHFAVCVRNMFEESRVTSPGLLTVDGAR